MRCIRFAALPPVAAAALGCHPGARGAVTEGPSDVPAPRPGLRRRRAGRRPSWPRRRRGPWRSTDADRLDADSASATGPPRLPSGISRRSRACPTRSRRRQRTRPPRVGRHGHGLARFDGIDLRAFRHSADTTSIAGNEVLALAAGRGGEVWAGTSEGLSRYDPAREAFSRVGGLPSDNVLAVAADSAGVAWVGTDKGFARVTARRRGRAAGRTSEVDPPCRPPCHNAVVQAPCPTPPAAPCGSAWPTGWPASTRPRGTSARSARGREIRAAGFNVAALAISERGSVLVGRPATGSTPSTRGCGASPPVDIGPGLDAEVVAAVHEDTGGTVWVGPSAAACGGSRPARA